ncbi:MAG: YbaB/EbfC family nucleoid-associated protein [Phycisphaerales bacterium]|nr:YbaB/EbfC family nucleoid-associated protein [Phycisphaerales bacterium]
MFDSLRGMAGMAGLMKDLPRIKAKLEEVKADVASREVEASTGGGAVTAVANGRLRIVRVTFDHALLAGLIDPDVPEDGALAADLITGASNAALDKAQEMVAAALQEAAGDLGLPIPAGALEGLL